MTKKTYRVQHAGQEFTRKTDRTYSHVVLAKDCRDADLRNMLDSADWRVKNDWAYYEREGGDNPKYSHNEEAAACNKRIAALGKEGWHQEMQNLARATVAQRAADGHYDRFGAYGWCGRIDLAQKQADKARKTGWFAEVVIVEVPQT